jgi:alpha-amylase
MGYDLFDHYDFGDKEQKGSVATHFGSKDTLLRLIAIVYANDLDVYSDIVLNHVIGAEEDLNASGDKDKKFHYTGFAGPASGRWPKDHWNFHPGEWPLFIDMTYS